MAGTFLRDFGRWLVSSARPAWRLRGAPALAPPASDPSQVEAILWVRTDAIGDAVLASDQLRGLAARFPGARIHVACQEAVAGLYGACPHVASVLPFRRPDLRRSAAARRAYVATVKALRADLAVNGVFSRETLTDLVALASEAPVRVAWRGDTARTPAPKLRYYEGFYTHLLDGAGAPARELERNAAFLDWLGAGLPDYGPRVWRGPADEAVAEALLAPVAGRPVLAFFPGAQRPERSYGRYGEALALAFPDGEAVVAALGAEADRAACEAARAAYPGPWLDLCGRTSLPATAAVLARCRAAFGAETGPAHLAAAVGTPVAVLLGGGHFGRFMPYAPGQSAACLPLACYGCDWRCPYPRAHCVADLDQAVLAAALREAWEAPRPPAAPCLHRPAGPPDLGPGGPGFDPGRAEALSPTAWAGLGPGTARG